MDTAAASKSETFVSILVVSVAERRNESEHIEARVSPSTTADTAHSAVVQ